MAGAEGPVLAPFRTAQMRERLGGHEDPSLGPIRVRAASGERTLYPTVERLPTASPANCHLGAFLRVADAVVASIPLSSASMLTHTVALFFDFLDWAGYTGPPAVPPVIAFMVARAVPPVDCPLPPGWLHPVLPTTAAGNVDALRRAARIGVPRAAPWLAAFESQAVFAFATAIGGRVRRLRSAKRPCLFAVVERAWAVWQAGGDGDLRDAAMMVLGFFFGMRAAEVVGLLAKDVVQLRSGVVRVSFRSRKTRRSVLGLHDPMVIDARHPMLAEATRRWADRLRGLGGGPESPLFPCLRGGTLRALTPAAVRKVVQRADPACVGHSLRVGMATEAWAAGVPLEAIQALGGWSSPVALMYIIGSQEETVTASSRLGSAAMYFDEDGLHGSLGTARLLRSTWSLGGMVDVGSGGPESGGMLTVGIQSRGRAAVQVTRP